jgi:hypothetical protein
VETAAFSRLVSVAFSGASATVNSLAGSGLTYAQSGAALVFSNTLKQVAFKLSGTTAAGSVKIYSDHAFKLALNSVSLTSSSGPAINIQSKKMCYVVLPAGTSSALTDCAAYATQTDGTNGVEDAKGVLFSEGPLLFSGTGRLSVNGVCAEKHGLCSDDAIRILDGDVRVCMTKKKSDGVHVNDRFRMDGGKLSVALTLKGDGIDADDGGSIQINGGEIAVGLAASESKGLKCGTNTLAVAGGAVQVTSAAAGCSALSGGGALLLGGGLVSATLTGADCNAIKSDGTVAVSGGSLVIAASGAQSKGIKSDGDALFTGGSIQIALSGDAVLETVTNASSFVYKDPAYPTGVKASNVVVHAGSFSMLVTGLAGRGFSADNDLTVNGGTFCIAATGAATGAFTNEAGVVDVAAAACMKAERVLAVNGGTFTFSVTGLAGRGFSSDASMLFNGGDVDLDLSGSAAFANHGTFMKPAYCSGVACGGCAAVSNGTFAIRHSGAAGRGFTVDGDMAIAGGSFAITTTGTNTSVYTSGVYVVNGATSNYVDVGSADAIKTDGSLTISGGTLSLLATGTCGKGIHVGGALTVGTNGAAAAPAITVKTTGKQVKLSGGTTGGGGPPDDNAEYENPKAIKAQGRITINGGFISASTANSGGEGIESKDTITVNGGSIETACYDDGMNASTNITINGGTVFCNTSNNDGIDSNGTLTLNGGVVASFGAAAPEEGLDCDQNTFTVNGGTFVGCGGATSNPNAGSQYSMIYTGTVASNTVVRITNTSGSSIFAFRMPRTYSASVKLVCGTPSMASSGTVHRLHGRDDDGNGFSRALHERRLRRDRRNLERLRLHGDQPILLCAVTEGRSAADA